MTWPPSTSRGRLTCGVLGFSTQAYYAWLTDITEHRTGQGKVYCCAIKDLFSNRILGYAIHQRMAAKLAVSVLRAAIARRQPDGVVVVHSDRGSQGGLKRSSQHLPMTEVADGATATASRPGSSTGDAVTWPTDPRQAPGA